MDSIKRFITCGVPVTACNFKCHYCYVGQKGSNTNQIRPFVAPGKTLAKYLSKERLGGCCYFNLCGLGETMLHPELIPFIQGLAANGHYADIITNGTISSRIDELIKTLTVEQQKHIIIKFSFHYLELKRTDLMDKFIENVNKIKESAISYSIEITPNDELVEHIDDIKLFSLKHFGALPHITVARNEATDEIALLTKYNREEYKKIWSTFDSKLFDFKINIFNQKRCEFCYAGDWSLALNLETGTYYQCYNGAPLGNICNGGPIRFKAIGYCQMPHCYNGHAFLALGNIPQMITPTYAEERDRETADGGHWLKDECRMFFSTKLCESNRELSGSEKAKALRRTKILMQLKSLKRNVKKALTKR